MIRLMIDIMLYCLNIFIILIVFPKVSTVLEVQSRGEM